ncbi:hypothetical protein [Chitinibacter tainanensis]|uniref:hypothetical protein n=1 Tax=Chitinibacter tainanensis TaxID=230667 RepID=UPI0023559CFA|nr:hypothetical protein [Chitinibacter tainanensis]
MLPLPLQINPVSRWERGFLCLQFGLALLAVGLLVPQHWAFALLGLPVLGAWRRYWRRPWQADVVVEVRALADGLFEITYRDGRQVVRALQQHWSAGGVLLLVWQPEKPWQRTATLIIWPDSAAPMALREWRIYLRWQHAVAALPQLPLDQDSKT